MLKCSRLRWVCAPQYLSAGTSTSPRLSNSRRIPAASSPIGRSKIFGVWLSVSVIVCVLPFCSLLAPPKSSVRGRDHRSAVVGRLPHGVLQRLHEVAGFPGGHVVVDGGLADADRGGRRGCAKQHYDWNALRTI